MEQNQIISISEKLAEIGELSFSERNIWNIYYKIKSRRFNKEKFIKANRYWLNRPKSIRIGNKKFKLYKIKP
jgi:hypothetical protein